MPWRLALKVTGRRQFCHYQSLAQGREGERSGAASGRRGDHCRVAVGKTIREEPDGGAGRDVQVCQIVAANGVAGETRQMSLLGIPGHTVEDNPVCVLVLVNREQRALLVGGRESRMHQ